MYWVDCYYSLVCFWRTPSEQFRWCCKSSLSNDEVQDESGVRETKGEVPVQGLFQPCTRWLRRSSAGFEL